MKATTVLRYHWHATLYFHKLQVSIECLNVQDVRFIVISDNLYDPTGFVHEDKHITIVWVTME